MCKQKLILARTIYFHFNNAYIIKETHIHTWQLHRKKMYTTFVLLITVQYRICNIQSPISYPKYPKYQSLVIDFLLTSRWSWMCCYPF